MEDGSDEMFAWVKVIICLSAFLNGTSRTKMYAARVKSDKNYFTPAYVYFFYISQQLTSLCPLFQCKVGTITKYYYKNGLKWSYEIHDLDLWKENQWFNMVSWGIVLLDKKEKKCEEINGLNTYKTCMKVFSRNAGSLKED